jgi:AcrR family transcriptional regulator
MDDVARRKRLTRAEAKAQTRSRLLDAAAQLFARKGYGGASVEDIADAAGYTIGAVYSNFGSKAQLMVELITSRASERVTEAARIVEESQERSESPLKALDRMFAEVADKDTDGPPLQGELWLYAVRNPEVMKILADKLEVPRESLARLIAAALERRAPAHLGQADVLATIVFALFDGLVRQRRIAPDTVPEDLYGQALRWLFIGVIASPALNTQDRPSET